jgi:hypothetical protein
MAADLMPRHLSGAWICHEPEFSTVRRAERNAAQFDLAILKGFLRLHVIHVNFMYFNYFFTPCPCRAQ